MKPARRRAAKAQAKKNKPKDDFWSIPNMWEGETIYVIGGGPSLLGFNFDRLRGERVIAINAAFLKLPFAQFAFFADNRFWAWHERAFMAFQHHVVSTARTVKPPHPHFHRINRNHDQTKWFSTEPNIVVGKDSGVQAINLAYHLGGARLVLLGFDMGFKQLTADEMANPDIKKLQVPHPTAKGKVRPQPSEVKHLAHWYQEHTIPSREQNYINRFLPQYSQVYKIVKEAGREMFLGTPSAIDCIPSIDIDEILGGLDVERLGDNPGQAALSERELHSWVTPTWFQCPPDNPAISENDKKWR